MTSLPSWIWMLGGGFLGAGGRALTSAAAKRIGGGDFRRLAMIEMLVAALLGAGVGWLMTQPDDAHQFYDLARFAAISFVLAVPGLGRKGEGQGEAFFRLFLTLGALFVGLAARRFLFAP